MLKKLKKSFGKVKLPEPQLRTIPEIQNEYNQLCAKAGAAQYQASVYQQEVDKLNKRILSLNEEAAARNEYDRQEAQTKAATAPVEQPKQEEVVSNG